jgi:hypothetical protein
MTKLVRTPVWMAASLLLPALAGCVQPFKKHTVAPVEALAPAPQPAPTPLYTAELTQSGPGLPELPNAPLPNAQPAPPPQSEVVVTNRKPVRVSRRTRARHEQTDVAERDVREKDLHDKESAPPVAPAAAPNAVTESAKVTAPTPTGDTAEHTPIGQLTAGPTQDSDESRRQTSDLIQNTQRGVNSLRRALSSEQAKTVAQIRSFLAQAERALHNGDVDGAYTLATKAKLLLDELASQG